jgi:hypothetical protein
MFPGTWGYQSDYPEAIRSVSSIFPDQFIGEFLSFQPGWRNILNHGRIANQFLNTGLVFNGITCPLSPQTTLGWIPLIRQNIEFSNEPEEAWWGSQASSSSVYLTTPAFSNCLRTKYILSSGWPSAAGIAFSIQDHNSNLEASYQNFFSNNINHNVLTGWSILVNNNIYTSQLIKFEDAIYSSKSIWNERWTVAYLKFQWNLGSFQTIKLKPYVQYANMNASQVTEEGAIFDYGLNFGSIIESGWRGEGKFDHGLNSSFLRSASFQNYQIFNILGMFELDDILRWDFQDFQHPSFSSSFGVKKNFKSICLFSTFDQATIPFNILERSIGISIGITSNLKFKIKFLNGFASSQIYDGYEINVKNVIFMDRTFFLKKAFLNVTERIIKTSNDGWTSDMGGEIRLTASHKISFEWIGRALIDQQLFSEFEINKNIYHNTVISLSWLNEWPIFENLNTLTPFAGKTFLIQLKSQID